MATTSSDTNTTSTAPKKNRRVVTPKAQQQVSAAPAPQLDAVVEALKGLDKDALQKVFSSLGAQAPAASKPAVSTDLHGPAIYVGYQPVSTEEIASSPDGSMRLMKESWKYTPRDAKEVDGKKEEKVSVKMSVRGVFRKQDNKLYFAQPMANIHLDQWAKFVELITAFKAQ